MVAGASRSGTTWIAELLGTLAPIRLMFEPFHPGVRDGGAFAFHYARPGEPDEALLRFCRELFTGRLRSQWIDRNVERLRPRYRVVKAVRANLMLGWITREFPEIPLLFLLRHPCAVVLSRLEMGWDAGAERDLMLGQPALVEDHLSAYLHVIEAARTPEEIHAVNWCIGNRVALRHSDAANIHVFRYERLVPEPLRGIEELAAAARLSAGLSSWSSDRPQARAVLSRPSTTTDSARRSMSPMDLMDRWRHVLSADQIERVLAVVEAFGLGETVAGLDRAG